MVAMASNPAVHATALLIPDATPDSRGPRAPMMVVASGATLIAHPIPRTTIAGKNVCQ
jgi:hypothetical protein